MPLELDQVEALRGDARTRRFIDLLRQAGYTLSQIAALVGESDPNSFITNGALCAMAYDDVLREDGSVLACLARLFLIGCRVDPDHYRVLPAELREIIEQLRFVMVDAHGRLAAEIAIGDVESAYLLSDKLFDFDGEQIVTNEAGDVVWPMSEWFMGLHQRLVTDSRWSRLLDVGCGNGCVSLAVRQRYPSITGIDLNPRAVAFAAVNAWLANASHADYLVADCLTYSTDTRFDHIVFAAPGGPGGGDGEVLAGDGGQLGHELLVRFLAERLDSLLAPGGACQVWVIFTVEERFGSIERVLAQALPHDRFDIAVDTDRTSGAYISHEDIISGTVPAGIIYTQARRDGKAFLAKLRAQGVVEVVPGIVTVRHRRA